MVKRALEERKKVASTARKLDTSLLNVQTEGEKNTRREGGGVELCSQRLFLSKNCSQVQSLK